MPRVDRDCILVVAADTWRRLLDHLNGTEAERMAFGYCSATSSRRRVRFVLREVALPDDDQYITQGRSHVTLGATDAVKYLVRARGTAAFLDAHAHPTCSRPWPSPIDERAAGAQYAALQTPAPGAALIRVIVSADRRVWAVAHLAGTDTPRPVDQIHVHGPQGLDLVLPVNARPRISSVAGAMDVRTISCLGSDGLSRARALTVAVIGVGGVGSMVARLLAGVVGGLVLIDPDDLEPHNAPRVWFANTRSRGPKVHAARRALRNAFPDLPVRIRREAFPSATTQQLLVDTDVIFACPDHHAVRYAASRAAAMSLTPLIEIGCGGRIGDMGLSALGSHVRLQVPGGPCLACNGLDLSRLEDPSTTAAKQRLGYVDNEHRVAGELACLTARAAADGVDVFLRYCTGYAGAPPSHLYSDALRFKTIDLSSVYERSAGCAVCGSNESGLTSKPLHQNRRAAVAHTRLRSRP